MLGMKRAGWVTDAETFTPDELLQEPDYRGFFLPAVWGMQQGPASSCRAMITYGQSETGRQKFRSGILT
jgi:hypothetical protein